jgi:ankyrin repeat protein
VVEDVNVTNNNDDTPLHYAAYVGNYSVDELLLTSGANINAVNDNNNTPCD